MEKRWTPQSAVRKANQYVEEVNVPAMRIDLGEREELDFSTLMNADTKKLELFLTVYGGYKAHLERELSDVSSKKNAYEAAFDEAYSSAIFKLAEEREIIGKKKLTREEVRGAAFGAYDELREMRKTVIEYETIHTRIEGLLKAYSSGFQTVSRIVALRTYKERDYA
jgi:hypothetical protein